VIQVTIKAPAQPCLFQHNSQYLSYEMSQDAPQLMNGFKEYGIYIKWGSIQQQRMKFYCLQVNAWNWRTSC
jgi:hypothetical protein